MDASQIYILVSILALAAIIFILFLTRGKKHKKISILTYLAFMFIIAGIIFGDSKYIGYSLMGIGVAIAIVDIIIKEKKK
jgi:uncharacterized membrane-anchored protein YitT (DUF2179 family)